MQGFVVIPKSTKQSRIADNANVFDFSLEKADLDVSALERTGEAWQAEEERLADGDRFCVQHLTTLDEFLVTDWEVSTVP